jgi:hypothetical protein
VTDASVSTIVQMQNLFSFYVRGTGVTANGAQAIRTRNSRVNVHFQ